MLYVFLVDTGTMLQFDMNYALESVAQLKEAIEKVTRIPPDKQVLLVSGGESLEAAARVCSYSAGTDTNPIYLFSKCSIESMSPPSPSINYGTDQDLKEQVDASEALEATYSSVVVRTQLAQQFHELAREQTRVCERLVHDQHLMQQGWAAVVANLEDITTAFRNRTEVFEQSFNQFLQTRADSIQLLHNYKDDLEVLAKIPMIPTLLDGWSQPLSTGSTSSSTSASAGRDGAGSGPPDGAGDRSGGSGGSAGVLETAPELGGGGSHTLLQWIAAKDKQASLENVAEMCTRALDQINSQVLEGLKVDVDAALDAAKKQEMKEIKGLEERLFGLEQLMFEARRIVQEQRDLAMAFQQNQKRVSNLKDPSIFPDLCTSHQRQLKVMLENQHRLRDIRRRCTRAKEELSTNLYHRLRWVMYVENRMCEVDSKLMIYHESMKRLRRSLEVVQQIHLTPHMYLSAVSEVVRRRSFSQAFLLWASDLACQLLAVHNEELARRRDFQAQFEGHFLNTLFPGMEDVPPAFATQAPLPFDCKLPKLSLEDLEELRSQLPELSVSVSLPDVSAITQLFLSRSLLGAFKGEDQEAAAVGKVLVPLLQAEEPLPLQPPEPDLSAGKPSPICIQAPTPGREADRGFESETDTEEFEKVGQSPVKLTAGAAEAGGGGGRPSTGGQPVAALGVAALEVGAPELRKPQASPSPSHSPSLTLSHQAALPQTLQEFATTEYYIDDSMPSSYTESSGAKCQHAAAPELQRQLEDVNSLVALLQENLGNTRGEVERLRGQLTAVGRTAAEAAAAVRADLAALREAATSQQEELLECASQLLAALAAAEEARATEECRLVQRLTVDHELEMDALKQEVKAGAEAKDEEVQQLQQDVRGKEQQLAGLRADMERRLREEERQHGQAVRELEERLQELRGRCERAQAQLEAAAGERQRAVREVHDNLAHEYKTELESLRSRFRLMAIASMERSPSDSSLEKIEPALVCLQRADMIELVNHEAIVQQLRENLEEQREAAVHAAVERERSQCEARLEQELKQARLRSEAERQVWFNEAMRRVMEEKERQVDALRAREASLAAECQRHQDTIRNLTDSRDAGGSLDSKMSGSTVWQLLDRIEQLKAEKRRVEQDLARERTRKTRTLSETAASDSSDDHKGPELMSSSVAVVQDTGGSRDVATSPEPTVHLREKLSQSTTSLIQQGKVSIVSCNIGDAVLVVWDEEHRNYTILQETSTLYFLHPDSLAGLGLRPATEDAPRRLYSTGEVTEKEYCHAKKPENRFRVPKGTKFYRVKVRPLQKESLLTRSHHQKQQRYLQHQQQQQRRENEQKGEGEREVELAPPLEGKNQPAEQKGKAVPPQPLQLPGAELQPLQLPEAEPQLTGAELQPLQLTEAELQPLQLTEVEPQLTETEQPLTEAGQPLLSAGEGTDTSTAAADAAK